MGKQKTLRTIGLMSGTSMDGVDAALIETNGEYVEAFGPTTFIPYDSDFVDIVRTLLGPDPQKKPNFDYGVRQLTSLHGDVVEKLLGENSISPDSIDVIGFHGQTVYHAPQDGITIQLGDAQVLADRLGITVVADFRKDDVAAGGQGAPLVPIFHQALSAELEKPLAVLNVGGVSNVTMLGVGEDEILAFDTGPGNALIDDWVRKAANQSCDHDGKLALAGTEDKSVLAQLMSHTFFDLKPPKSLDRNTFNTSPVDGLSLEDGAATLTAFSAETVARGCAFVSTQPKRWLVCGGGRQNRAIMSALSEALGVSVEPVEAVGWQGDALEAQAFGFLAARVLYSLPTSLPSTTGTGRPISGGKVFQPVI